MSRRKVESTFKRYFLIDLRNNIISGDKRYKKSHVRTLTSLSGIGIFTIPELEAFLFYNYQLILII